MNREKQRLQRLLERARRERPSPETTPSAPQPPPGFVTRVAAQWAHSRDDRPLADAWERLSWVGSACAAVICLATILYQHQAAAPTGLDLLLETPAVETIF